MNGESNMKKYINRDADRLSDRKHRYLVISKVILEDERLTSDDIGVLSHLLNNKNDFNQRLDALQNKAGISKGKFDKIIQKLKALGYVERRKSQNNLGQWNWETFVYEIPRPPGQKPDSGLPVDGNPKDGTPVGGNMGVYNKDYLNEDKEMKNSMMSTTKQLNKEEKTSPTQVVPNSYTNRGNHTLDNKPLDKPDDLPF